jgi:hypothetical protein
MALTLLQSNIYNNGTVYERTIVENIVTESEVLRVLPFKNISGNAYSYPQVDRFASNEFRRVNEPFNESTTTFRKITEELMIAGGRLDVDKFLVDTNGQEERAIQEYLKQVSLTRYWTKTFINGDNSLDDRQFDGIKKRITGNQLLTAGTTAGGDTLKFSYIDALIRAVKNPTHLIMNASTRDLITQGARNPAVGGITWKIDEFGRSVASFGALPILIAGVDELENEIIGNNEPNPAAGTDALLTSTSIYCVSMRPGGVLGLQNGEVQVLDQGLVHPWYRTVIEWYSTIMMQDTKAAARLAGIKYNNAVVAG